jgi:type IV secretion system protein VirD4
MPLFPILAPFGAVLTTIANRRRYGKALRNLQGSDVHGGARFLTSEEIVQAGLTVTPAGQVGGILIGGQGAPGEPDAVVCYAGERHLITFAPTRSGKGACHVVPNLLLHEGATFVIDVKGENFLATQRQRRGYGPVHAFAPYDTRIPTSRINPLDFIRRGTVNEADDARTIAALLIEASGSEKDKFWEEAARSLLAGLILYTIYEAPSSHRTLSAAIGLLLSPLDQLDAHIARMSRHSVGAIATAGAAARGMTEEMLRSIVASASSQVGCWAPGGALELLTNRSDFAFDVLRQLAASFFLILPPERIRENRSVLRLLCGIAIRTLTRSWPKPDAKRILFILDEFANLGRMEDVEDGVTYLAGNGIQLWMIVQDFSQLKNAYKEKAETIFANCGARIVFNVQDLETAKKVSEMIGNRTVVLESPTQTSGPLFMPGSVGTGHSLAGRPLLTPDEVMRLDRRRQIVFLDENRPILGEKWFYFERPEFAGLFDDPRPLLAAASLPMLGSPKLLLPMSTVAASPSPPNSLVNSTMPAPVRSVAGRSPRVPASAAPTPAASNGSMTHSPANRPRPGRPPRRKPPNS